MSKMTYSPPVCRLCSGRWIGLPNGKSYSISMFADYSRGGWVVHKKPIPRTPIIRGKPLKTEKCLEAMARCDLAALRLRAGGEMIASERLRLRKARSW